MSNKRRIPTRGVPSRPVDPAAVNVVYAALSEQERGALARYAALQAGSSMPAGLAQLAAQASDRFGVVTKPTIDSLFARGLLFAAEGGQVRLTVEGHAVVAYALRTDPDAVPARRDNRGGRHGGNQGGRPSNESQGLESRTHKVMLRPACYQSTPGRVVFGFRLPQTNRMLERQQRRNAGRNGAR